MNNFYIAKKFSYYNSLLNIIGSIAWLLLLLLIIIYHFGVLIDRTGTKNYSILTAHSSSVTSSSSAATATVQPTNNYSLTYINSLGYKTFFSGTLIGNITFWEPVLFLFSLALFCYCLKTISAIFVLLVSIKAKSILYIYTSLIDIFCPLWGGLFGLYVAKQNYRKEGHKAIYPLHWIKFKIKTLLQNVVFDAKYKSL